MRVIWTYMECTKVTTDYWDITLSVITSFISIIGITKQISIIKLALEIAHQMVSNDILYIIGRLVFIEI